MISVVQNKRAVRAEPANGVQDKGICRCARNVPALWRGARLRERLWSQRLSACVASLPTMLLAFLRRARLAREVPADIHMRLKRDDSSSALRLGHRTARSMVFLCLLRPLWLCTMSSLAVTQHSKKWRQGKATEQKMLQQAQPCPRVSSPPPHLAQSAPVAAHPCALAPPPRLPPCHTLPAQALH